MLNPASVHSNRWPLSLASPDPARQSLRSLLAKKRLGSVLLYTTGAFILAVCASFLFNIMDHNTEFAIAVTGSLIGGFLGAMLAATLIVDGQPATDQRDQK